MKERFTKISNSKLPRGSLINSIEEVIDILDRDKEGIFITPSVFKNNIPSRFYYSFISNVSTEMGFIYRREDNGKLQELFTMAKPLLDSYLKK